MAVYQEFNRSSEGTRWSDVSHRDSRGIRTRKRGVRCSTGTLDIASRSSDETLVPREPCCEAAPAAHLFFGRGRRHKLQIAGPLTGHDAILPRSTRYGFVHRLFSAPASLRERRFGSHRRDERRPRRVVRRRRDLERRFRRRRRSSDGRRRCRCGRFGCVERRRLGRRLGRRRRRRHGGVRLR